MEWRPAPGRTPDARRASPWHTEARPGRADDLQRYACPVRRVVGCGGPLPLGDAHALTARAYAWRYRCDYQGGRRQDLALFDGQLAPPPRRGHAHSCRGDGLWLATGTFHAG